MLREGLAVSSTSQPESFRDATSCTLPKADELYSRIMAHASMGQSAGSGPDSFFHQVLSTSQISTGVQGATRPLPEQN